MTRMGAAHSPVVMSLDRWLLGLAALCLLAQSTLVPLVVPAVAAWDPGHAHLTLNGVVPPHRHVFTSAVGGGEKGCVASSDGAAAVPEVPRGDEVVCTPSNTGATGTVALAVHAPAPLAGVNVGGFEQLTWPAGPPAWLDVAADVQTPPPRS